jgi:hypothetical protein
MVTQKYSPEQKRGEEVRLLSYIHTPCQSLVKRKKIGFHFQIIFCNSDQNISLWESKISAGSKSYLQRAPRDGLNIDN